MNKYLAWAMAPLLLGVAAAAEHAPLTTHQSHAGQLADDWTDAIKKALVVYENKETFVQKVRLAWLEMFQVADVQPNGSNGLHLKKGASPVNQEFRRTYLGLNVDMASGTQFHAWLRPGGLPVRETYSNGRTKRNFSYTDFFDIWLKQDISAVKGLSIKAGKMASRFTSDYITSSSQLLCVERSLLSNQFSQDSNWGVSADYAPNKQTRFFAQLLANDRANAAKSLAHRDVYRDGRGFKGEFGWEDKCFAIIGASHRFHVTERGYQEISGQLYHDFNNKYHGNTPGANSYGLGFKDAISLGYAMKRDRFSVMANLVSAFEQQKGNGSNNIGIQIQPVYSLNNHVDLVFRYTGMTGDHACYLGGDRYICTQTTANAWVDSLHAFYFGVDLYASAKNPHAAKLMFGAEYLTARRNGADAYNGWEFSTAARWNF